MSRCSMQLVSVKIWRRVLSSTMVLQVAKANIGSVFGAKNELVHPLCCRGLESMIKMSVVQGWQVAQQSLCLDS